MSTVKKGNSTISLNEQILGEACTFNEVIRIISPQWKMQILFSICRGINRFSLLKREYPSLSDEILSKRLKQLTNEGLVNRADGTDPKHPLVTYYATPKAEELLQVVPLLCQWGDKWLAESSKKVGHRVNC